MNVCGRFWWSNPEVANWQHLLDGLFRPCKSCHNTTLLWNLSCFDVLQFSPFPPFLFGLSCVDTFFAAREHVVNHSHATSPQLKMILKCHWFKTTLHTGVVLFRSYYVDQESPLLHVISDPPFEVSSSIRMIRNNKKPSRTITSCLKS